MPTHLLFDFFGTLVRYSASRTEQGYDASHALLRDAGSKLDYAAFLELWVAVADGFEREADRTLVEFSMDEVCAGFLERALGHPAARPLVASFVSTYIAEWNAGVEYLPDVPGLLERLGRHYTLAVITNTHHAALVPDHLERMGIAKAFDRVVTSVEHGLRKPHPAIFRAALDDLGARAEDSVYIGDSYRADYVGSNEAGLRGLLIDPDRTAPVDESDRIANLFEIEHALR